MAGNLSGAEFTTASAVDLSQASHEQQPLRYGGNRNESKRGHAITNNSSNTSRSSTTNRKSTANSNGNDNSSNANRLPSQAQVPAPVPAQAPDPAPSLQDPVPPESQPSPAPAKDPAPTIFDSLPPGATVFNPTAFPSVEINIRSCMTCRKRRVRCDKYMPCANCRRAKIPCVFPGPQRAPRSRKHRMDVLRGDEGQREIELVMRLRKLEGLVEDLSNQLEQETAETTDTTEAQPQPSSGPLRETVVGTYSGKVVMTKSGTSGRVRAGAAGLLALEHAPRMGLSIGDPGRFGRLVVNDHGRSRYVSSGFWSRINDEVRLSPHCADASWLRS